MATPLATITMPNTVLQNCTFSHHLHFMNKLSCGWLHTLNSLQDLRSRPLIVQRALLIECIADVEAAILGLHFAYSTCTGVFVCNDTALTFSLSHRHIGCCRFVEVCCSANCILVIYHLVHYLGPHCKCITALRRYLHI